MSIVIGIVLIGLAETFYLIGYYAVRRAQPPFWTSDDMLMTFVGPGIMILAVSGFVLVGAPFMTGAWTEFDLGNLAEVGILAAVYVVLWRIIARRHYKSVAQATSAEVIPLPVAAASMPLQEAAAPLKAA